MLRIHSAKPLEQLKQEAEGIGIPAIAVGEEGLLGLSYNQIPLSKIPAAVDRLIRIWKD